MKDFQFELTQGERIFLHGKNGCGKSTLIKAILQQAAQKNTLAISRNTAADTLEMPSQGERIFLHGKNGCGKSTLIKAILQQAAQKNTLAISRNTAADTLEMPFSDAPCIEIRSGILETVSGLVISYINQDTSFLRGSLTQFCEDRKLDKSLFLALLRQLDLEREQFSKNMEEFSEGQKKKILIAASLQTPAHLYIWDEPLNFIDVFSRMQIETLILKYRPTMLLVAKEKNSDCGKSPDAGASVYLGRTAEFHRCFFQNADRNSHFEISPYYAARRPRCAFPGNYHYTDSRASRLKTTVAEAETAERKNAAARSSSISAFLPAPDNPETPRSPFPLQIIQKRLAAFHDIVIRDFKISGIPRVGNIPRTLRIIQKPRNLVIRVAAGDTQHVADVITLCCQQIIIFFIILLRHLARPLARRVDSVLAQLALCGRVYRIADFLATGGSGGDLEIRS